MDMIALIFGFRQHFDQGKSTHFLYNLRMTRWLENVAELRLNCAPTIYACPLDWRWKRQRFPDLDFWLVLSGQGELRLDHRVIPVFRGSFFLWQPGDALDAWHDTAHPLTVFFCHFDALDPQGNPLTPSPLPRPLQVDDLQYFEGCARRAEKLWMRGQSAHAEVRRILRSLLWQVADEAENGIPAHDERMEQLAARLRVDFAAQWTLEKMARITYLSRSQVVRRFQARFNATPSEFLQRTRIENARQLLLETDFSLDVIAARTGFCDAAHLSRSFKISVGFPPGALRKR